MSNIKLTILILSLLSYFNSSAQEVETEKVQMDEDVYTQYYSYLWIENTTGKEIIVLYRSNTQTLYTDTVILKPKENKKVILELGREDFKDPKNLYAFEFYKGTKKKKKYSLEFAPVKHDEKNTKLYEKNYYYQLVK